MRSWKPGQIHRIRKIKIPNSFNCQSRKEEEKGRKILQNRKKYQHQTKIKIKIRSDYKRNRIQTFLETRIERQILQINYSSRPIQRIKLQRISSSLSVNRRSKKKKSVAAIFICRKYPCHFSCTITLKSVEGAANRVRPITIHRMTSSRDNPPPPPTSQTILTKSSR